MVFSSYEFVFVFLPIVLIVYYALSRLRNSLYQRVFLIVASLVFYAYFNISYLLLILSSVAVNYAVATLIQRGWNAPWPYAKVMLVFGVLFNVALIGYFKYYDFFIENLIILHKQILH